MKNSNGILQWLFAIIVILSYMIFIIHLVKISDPSKTLDSHWLRLVFLFSSLEAIAFAAAGFVFGREVTKSQAQLESKQEKDKVLKNLYSQIPDVPLNPEMSSMSSSTSSYVSNLKKIIIEELGE